MAFSAADIQGRWQEPVRPRGLGFWLKPIASQTATIPQSSSMLLGRYPPLTEPVRLKPGLMAGLQHYLEVVPPAYYGPPTPPSSNGWLEAIHESNWHYPWSEPGLTRLDYKRSITTGSQQAFSGPSRLLPAISFGISLAATESGSDVAEMAVNVYDTNPITVDLSGANVSIEEVSIPANNPASIRTES